MHTLRTKTRTAGIAFFTCVLLLLGAAAAHADPIILKNDTYSPMHFRVRTSSGMFSEWGVVLPAGVAKYEGHAHLIAEIWWSEARTTTFKVLPGSYTWYRNEPRGVPRFEEGTAKSAIAPPASPAAGQAPFAPLESFIAHCKEHKQPYQLSLKKLAAECAEAQKAGPLPSELRYLRGFTWLFGYLMDDANNDVILLGVKDPTRPPLDIDCLATAINAVSAGVVPQCSLEHHSDPEFLKSIVAGVPWKTRYAEVMIQADYDMGRIRRGSLKPSLPGFKNDHDIFAEVLSTQGRNGEMGSFRSWFHFNSDVPRTIADASGKVLYLHTNPVRLSTEKQVDGAYGSGETTVTGRRFADSFTKHMDDLGREYPSIAELQALFRLYDLIQHVNEVGKAEIPNLDYWVSKYEHPYAGPPATMPRGQAVTRIIRERKDVPRPAPGTSFSGTETLAGYNRLRFDLHANGRATMHDAAGTVQGFWGAAGDHISLRFHEGSVIYQGTWNTNTLSGTASNGKTTWSWKLDTGYETLQWTFR